jgi:hypothetical protein
MLMNYSGYVLIMAYRDRERRGDWQKAERREKEGTCGHGICPDPDGKEPALHADPRTGSKYWTVEPGKRVKSGSPS